jgi:DNA mismatch repair protein MutL
MQIWGHNFAQNLVEIPQELLVTGLISNHNFWRYGRQQIFFFVNNRWVKNSELSKAVMKGYRNVLPPARFPAIFLFIDIDKSLVDVNVHPRKEEVRFVKPVTVQNKIQEVITKTLESLINKQLGGTTAPVVLEPVAPDMSPGLKWEAPETRPEEASLQRVLEEPVSNPRSPRPRPPKSHNYWPNPKHIHRNRKRRRLIDNRPTRGPRTNFIRKISEKF